MRLPVKNCAPIYRTVDIRNIETRDAGLPLMERAGLPAAEFARDIAQDNGKRILIYAGPGNNGGDAFVVARHLRKWWFDVCVVFDADEEKLPKDAGEALLSFRAAGGITQPAAPSGIGWSLVIDGLLGIGLTRNIEGKYADVIREINLHSCPILALDIPSGLEADSGRILGIAVNATHTITFIGLKPGLLTLHGPDQCGKIVVDDLRLASMETSGTLIATGEFDNVLPARKKNSHKGTYGSVGIIGGAAGMVGAALLAGRAALQLGAGRVYLGLIDAPSLLVDVEQPELMLGSADATLKTTHLTALAVGPGLGQSPGATHYLRWAISRDIPLVLDADALNLIAAQPGIADNVAHRSSATLMTPHPAEAARLLSISTEELQNDRVAAALSIARKFQAHVVLKGAGSVCASPNGKWRINTSGNPGMASAGMGDVLTGIAAAMLAQGIAPSNALHSAVWLHGAAADECVAVSIGPVWLTASEVTHAAGSLANSYQYSASANFGKNKEKPRRKDGVYK